MNCLSPMIFVLSNMSLPGPVAMHSSIYRYEITMIVTCTNVYIKGRREHRSGRREEGGRERQKEERSRVERERDGGKRESSYN